ncbi:MarR family transcriptional regulator [Microbacterium sp. LX3-4]|uniref:MarR family transcriptional regulator n=1 Tax=Microbacterium dauci TaxID=3048008 RepID=A0ABT6ZEP4_9MICO|nr:MarR family transcriptional regulator [Microbacterium sp. LX3-4]MDJ1114624.1 MarR family transcriptional regulator [Microbacterium sp. LX3-4]
MIDEMVCFGMYSASHAFAQAYRRVLAPWQLTYPQYLVLVALWDREPRSVKELGAELHLDSGTLSPLLRRLVARAFVTKTRRSGDDRVVEVALTAQGRALQAEMAGVAAEIAQCTGLTGDRAREMLAAVHEMTAALRQTAEAAASR